MLTYTLLNIQPNQNGSFVSWLEELGLKDLIYCYSLPKLLEWGWLVPQYRVAFLSEYLEDLTPENISDTADYSISKDQVNRLLGNGVWWQIEDAEDPLWFLHPFCRPGSVYNKLLNQTDSSATPNVYYFFHWQAYALIDVVREASMGAFPILNTPDIEQDISRIANCKIKPTDALNQPHRWGGLAKPMTWISHYRAFREALANKKDKSLFEQGAVELAKYFEIDAEILEKAIKAQLLEGLAGDWLWANEHCCEWTLRAWPYLQKDIFFAMEWLCTLNGNSRHYRKLDRMPRYYYILKWFPIKSSRINCFNDYLRKWQFSDKRKVWPPLHKVLPFEYFEDRQFFLYTLPRYKKFYNGILPTDEKLDQLVTRLQEKNYPFDSFLNAFRQFHEHLMQKPQQKGSLDFRVLRPLDYFSLLAIRAETCLRYDLEDKYDLEGKNLLETIKDQGLVEYINKLAEQKNSTAIIKDCFNKGVKNLTRLHKTPENPIDKIKQVRCDSVQDTHLLQAFLCCVLARNYFAHHTYLDKDFMQNQKEESAFILIGILVTVLKLLDDQSNN